MSRLTCVRGLLLTGCSLASVIVAGCGSPVPVGEARSELTARKGVDYSFARPSPGGLSGEGWSFAARYVSDCGCGKNVTKGEADALIAAGVDVVLVWENAGTEAGQAGSFNVGVGHAQRAQAQALAAGMPATRPIYFALDYDAPPGDQPNIDAYLDGVASVLGRERTGLYAGYWPLSRAFDAGKITFGWQTYAWSGGNWDNRAQLRQTLNGITAAGDGNCCDEDHNNADDFGQWGVTTPVPPCPAGQVHPPGDANACIVPFDYRVFLADFDGNGTSDLLTVSANGGGEWATKIALELSTGKSFTSASWAANTPIHMRNGGSASRYRVVLGDFDGDRKADLLTISPNAAGGWADWTALELSTGQSFSSVTWTANTPQHMRNGNPDADYRTLVGDFNGDGLSDLATVSPDAGGGWATWIALELSTGKGFTSATWNADLPMHMRNGGAADYRIVVGDFNGDGKSDLAAVSPNGGGSWNVNVFVALSTGSGFTSAAWAAATPTHMRNGGSASDYRVLVGDFDGDGVDDLATVSPDGGGGWADWAALELSTGSGWKSASWTMNTPQHMRNGGAADYRVLVGDFDGNGRSDIATVSPNGGGGWASWSAIELSTGQGFTSTTWNANTPIHMRNGGSGSDYHVLVGDVDGDAKSDLVTVSTNGLGGWVDWAAVELDTGGGFASATWNARTASLMHSGGNSVLAPRTDETWSAKPFANNPGGTSPGTTGGAGSHGAGSSGDGVNAQGSGSSGGCTMSGSGEPGALALALCMIALALATRRRAQRR